MRVDRWFVGCGGILEVCVYSRSCPSKCQLESNLETSCSPATLERVWMKGKVYRNDNTVQLFVLGIQSKEEAQFQTLSGD
jgi:hypothetical protein